MRVLGVDLGTSSIKLLVLDGERMLQHSQQYAHAGFEGHYPAFLAALRALGKVTELSRIEAIGLSGQTGSYAVLDEAGTIIHQLSWQDPGRQTELDRLLSTIDPDYFLKETGMVQPRVASYPLPTIRLLKDHLAPGRRLLQPKDHLCLQLCGEAVTDPYSWRGLANPLSGHYSAALLQEVGLGLDSLPAIRAQARLSRQASRDSGLREGLPIAVGLNDFYASLVGLGVSKAGDAFDVAGTSEHLGVLKQGPLPAPLIRSPFPGGSHVHYGVTGTSGVALTWGAGLFGPGDPPIKQKAPLFLPYLRGERAPVFDEKARGMFIGLSERSDPEALKYSVMEGVVFSLYSIFEKLEAPVPQVIHATGGPTDNHLLNTLKASLFGAPLLTGPSSSGSAIGAAVLAGAERPSGQTLTQPDPSLNEGLHRRYRVWQRAYAAWQQVVGDEDTEELF